MDGHAVAMSRGIEIKPISSSHGIYLQTISIPKCGYAYTLVPPSTRYVGGITYTMGYDMNASHQRTIVIPLYTVATSFRNPEGISTSGIYAHRVTKYRPMPTMEESTMRI